MDDLSCHGGRGRSERHTDSRLPDTLNEIECLAASIERAVSLETAGGVWNLRVVIDQGGVRLTGRCHSYYTKQKAQHAAMAVRGSGPLTNLIEVS
jgi:osmotically-inducible protein OsmY